MRTNSIILLAALLPAAAFAQEKPFTVTVKTALDIHTIVLNRYTLATGGHKDTATVIDGKAIFKGMVDERQIGQLTMPQKQGGGLFYLESGNITVDIPNKIVGGTPLNKDFQAYRILINQMVDSASAAGKATTEFDRTLLNAKFNVIRKFMAAHPSSAISVDLLNQIGIGYKDQELMMVQYDKLTAAAKKSPQGKELLNRIKGMGAAQPGNMAPAFTLPDTEGKNVSLADYKGKYVLIDFWATWCGPCMAEMPNIIKAYTQYKDKNFEILGVSLDRPDSKALWLKVIQRDKLTWPQVSDLKWWNSTAALLYNVNSVPANFLVDPQGKIIATNLRAEALQKKLAEIL